MKTSTHTSLRRLTTAVAAAVALSAIMVPAALAEKPSSKPASAAAKTKVWNVKVSRGTTTLSGFATGLSATAFTPAKLKDGALSFPVTQGKLKVTEDATTKAITSVAGYVMHVGGVELEVGDKSAKARNPVIKFLSSGVELWGKVGGKPTQLGTITGATVAKSADGKRLQVTGGQLVVSQALVDALGVAPGTVAASSVGVDSRILPIGAK